MASDYDGVDEPGEGWSRWRRLITILLALLLSLALALLVFLADNATDARDRALLLQRHSFQVMTLTYQVDGSIANAEALLARYVLSLDQKDGQRYQDAWLQGQAQLKALEQVTRAHHAQRANVAALRTVVDQRGKTLNDIALRTTYKQKLLALGEYYAAGKSPVIKQIRDRLKTIIDFENQELTRRNILVSQSEARVNRLYDSYGIMGLALLVAALLALWFASSAATERSFARRLAASEIARVEGLESAVHERTEQLEAANEQLRLEMEERAQAERSLRQMQKMEAIGQLTGGIAHDFNNMLAVVVSGIELAGRAAQDDPVLARQHLASALDGASRAAMLTDRLLAYARAEPLLAGRVAPDLLIGDMRDLVDRSLGDGIAVDLDLDGDDWTIWADRAQLENALVNLAVNARDAMAGRGALTIATRRLVLDDGEIGNNAAGEYVSIAVTDTGQGMSAEVIERAFEPFFTTKPVGKGTGLGLSQIFGFVKQCAGEIDIVSVPGDGTTVRLLLPRAAPATAEEIARQRRAASAASQAEADGSSTTERTALTILVVEDDQRVRTATLHALEAIGHEALACDHPGKAGAILAANPDIALILSDVLMPDMTGPEMIAQLGDKRGGRPVIFVTGYTGDSAATAILSDFLVLRKPFTLAQLSRAIDQACREQRAP